MPPQERLFPLWDWVGGRYSVCSSVGALPLSLKYGFRQFENFLAGERRLLALFSYNRSACQNHDSQKPACGENRTFIFLPLPLGLKYGFRQFENFLAGERRLLALFSYNRSACQNHDSQKPARGENRTLLFLPFPRELVYCFRLRNINSITGDHSK